MQHAIQKKNLGNKVLIIGCAGSGKTTLAKQLSPITGLPIIYLDKHYWNPNWEKKPDDTWLDTVNELCQQPQWIMDGNYTDSLPTRISHATAIIYLDTPRWKCLLRAIIRQLRPFHNKQRNDMPAGCTETFNMGFYRWIWNYPKRSRNKTLALLAQSKATVFHLTSNADIHDFIRNTK